MKPLGTEEDARVHPGAKGEICASVPPPPAPHLRWQTAEAVGLAKDAGRRRSYLGGKERGPGSFPDP